MKKLLALLLVFALLLPMATVTNAAGAEKKPFYLTQWEAFQGDYSNIYPMPLFITNDSGLGDPLTSNLWKGKTDIKALAAALKELFDTYPEGTRHINFEMVQIAFYKKIKDVFIVNDAIPIVQEWVDAFCKEYKAIGGKLDGLVCDLELTDANSYYIDQNYYSKDSQIYHKIAKNPVYQSVIRPMLVERGFKFYNDPTGQNSELYSIYPKAGDEYAQSRQIWDAVAGSYVAQCVSDACSPMWKYFPDAIVTDYTTSSEKPWVQGGSGGITTIGGLTSNDNFYQDRPYNTVSSGFGSVDGYNRATLDNKPFNFFLYDTNHFKSVYLAAEGGKVSWWIAPYLWDYDYRGTTAHTPYYIETLLHMGMLDPEVTLGWILAGNCGGNGAYQLYELSLQMVDDVMKELTARVGYADRKPIAVTPRWNEHYVLSGMSAGGKNVWRLTPDITQVALNDFQVKGASDPTFTVNGQTITFPQGKIIADGKVAGLDANDKEITNNTCGFWIETPANVMPVETRAKNYHSEYPAYGDNFDSYAEGMEYNYKNAKPAGCWQVSKKGQSSAVIAANGNDKVLAMKGTYTLKNINVTANITAGDNYAKNQVWEVSVTVPSDMAADAEVVVLNAVSEKRRVKDGGFKIAGGKLYYGKGEEYVEMSGVTVNAGTEYRLVRELDFTDEKALKSSYYVYDASGTLLGSAKKVEMVAIDLPIASVNLATKNVAGNPVLLDNYKLYPIKVTTDFYLYTAKLGMPVADQSKAIGESAAYRLSWMNTTNDVKSYSVVAAYYNGDSKVSEEVVKELKLAPNTEGVETGIVELGSKGGAVLVYLRDNNPAEPDGGDSNQGGNNQGGSNQGGSGNTNNTEPTTGTEPTTDGTEPSQGTEPIQGTEPTTGNTDNNQGDEKTGLSTGALIGIIVGAVVVLAGAAVAVVLLLKKKAANADETEAPAEEATEEVSAEDTVEGAQEDAE